MSKIGLHRGTTSGEGLPQTINYGSSQSITLQAALDAGGGTGEGAVYGRVDSDMPWGDPLWTFTLSGANDSEKYILDERWAELKGVITSAGGGAVVTIKASN